MYSRKEGVASLAISFMPGLAPAMKGSPGLMARVTLSHLGWTLLE